MTNIASMRMGGCALVLVSLLLVFLALSGCSSDYTPTTSGGGISIDDIADMVGGSIAGKTATCGLTAQFADAAVVAGGGTLTKRSLFPSSNLPSFDTTIIRHDSVGSRSYYFTIHYGYSFQSLNTLSFNDSLSGYYSTAIISSRDSAVGNFVLTGITSADTVYLLSGSYGRIGNQVSKVRNHDTFSSSLVVSVDTLIISKATNRIIGGSWYLDVSGRYAGDQFFEYSGTLVITGPASARLTLNNKSYNIDLTTGAATHA